MILNKKQRYLQIALNGDLNQSRLIVEQIPLDKRIILEAGTPLIKEFGINSVRMIKNWLMARVFAGQQAKGGDFFNYSRQINSQGESKPFFNPYVVADLKCMDRGEREVRMCKETGASAVTCLGHAPLETLDAFLENCEKFGLDSMIDMMNVDFPLNILRKLKKQPTVIILHRGVDEEMFNKEKEIPYHEIARIKNEYDSFIAVAGGDTFEEVRRALFNDADIAVVWKQFYQSSLETAQMAEKFLTEIR